VHVLGTYIIVSRLQGKQGKCIARIRLALGLFGSSEVPNKFRVG